MGYINEYFIEPDGRFPKRLFEEMSYARWAAFEIVELLMDRPYDSPDEVVGDFLLRMALYSQTANTPEKKRIFSIGENVAEEILSLFD
jgi:hypothetical protein